MHQGKIVEYIDQGKVVCSLCLQDKGNRLRLLTLQNREVNLPPKRALLISNSSMDSMNPREELISRLKQTDELRNRLKDQIQVKELWELIRDEKESFNYRYLAQLCFGETVADEHISALLRALFEDRLYFKMKEGRFLPNPEETVEQIVRQREEEALKEEYLKQGSAWLKEVLQDRNVEPPSSQGAIIDLLVELALYGKEAPNFKYGRELLLRTGISDIQKARDLLIRLGVWEEDEPVDLFRLDIRTAFNEEQLNEADRLSRVQIETTARVDLRDLEVFTIDGPLTRDFDDALSIQMEDEYIQLGIHITDVASVVKPGSILDNEASLRGSSLYLPRRQIPMLPLNLSQETLSLKQGCDRPTISLFARYDKTGNLIDYQFMPGLVRVNRRLTYDQVNEIYLKESQLEQMYLASQKMHQKRIDQGALVLSLPEISIRVDADSSISLDMISQQTPSRLIVSEFMILYNWLAARFCADNLIPILYRSQEKPSERLSIDDAGYIYFVFRQRRKLNPLIIDTEPRSHTGLGLDAYTNVSSPIRRYFDLIVQRQMVGFLINKSIVYNREELENIRVLVEPAIKDREMVKRSRVRYWVQKYLGQHIGETFPAIILDTMKSRYRLLLTDFLLIAEMKREDGQVFSPGESIAVKVKKVDPWNDQLHLEHVHK